MANVCAAVFHREGKLFQTPRRLLSPGVKLRLIQYKYMVQLSATMEQARETQLAQLYDVLGLRRVNATHHDTGPRTPRPACQRLTQLREHELDSLLRS